MQYVIKRVDVSQQLSAHEQPTVMLKRNEEIGVTSWYVPSQEVDTKNKFKWMKTSEAEFVRIPLFQYLTTDARPETLYGYAMQLGFALSVNLPVRLSDDATLLLCIGNVFQHHAEGSDKEQFEFWCGMAIKQVRNA